MQNKVRVQVSEDTGEMYLVLPDDFVEDYFIQEGDRFEWRDEEDHFTVHPTT